MQMGADNRQNIVRQTIRQEWSDDLLYFRKPLLRFEVSPAFLLQLGVFDTCWNDDGFGYNGDRLPL
jgi:hypothetical protein